ncbi:hypothetical protein ACE1OC_42745 (plasmid) [Streptomyces sp. DSM 116496]|uniref:hypothetical protein n=1 Tax=Streptomyces stoeckheimensis TaxID=3344656 RepID=UPI0038B38CAB
MTGERFAGPDAQETLGVLAELGLELVHESRVFASGPIRCEPVTDPAIGLSRLTAELAATAARLDQLRAGAGAER